jgi:hypothetical protein
MVSVRMQRLPLCDTFASLIHSQVGPMTCQRRLVFVYAEPKLDSRFESKRARDERIRSGFGVASTCTSPPDN